MPETERVCNGFVWSACGFGVLVSLSNLAVWLLPTIQAKVAGEGVSVMRANTAVALLFASISLILWNAGKRHLASNRMAAVFGGLVALIGGATTAEYLLGVNLGLDQLIAAGTFPGDKASAFVVVPGRMSLNAALGLLFIGLALTRLDAEVRFGKTHHYHTAQFFALLAVLPAGSGLVGYLLSNGGFTGLLRSTNILLHTAAALFLLSLGVLAARPSRRPLNHIFSAGADGVLLRRLLPGSTIMLLALGWLIHKGRGLGMVAPGEGTAMMLYGGLLLLFVLIVSASRSIARLETSAHSAIAALQKEEELSSAILDTSLDGILLIDSKGMVMDWNPAAEQIFGWKREEVFGKLLADYIIPERLRDAHARGLARYMESGQGPVLGKRVELPALRRDGTEFPVELNINPLKGINTPVFVGFIRDITDRKAAEQAMQESKEKAEKASQAKDDFLAALSHELRTPLSPVLLSASNLMRDERLPEDVREDLAMIERNISLEGRLIDDLLDLTRISRGKLKLRLEGCDAHALLGHALEMVQEEAAEKQQKLLVELQASQSSLIGDMARLQQVFWNLLRNAVKFTPVGGSVTLRTSNAASDHSLILEVIDTGIGFAPELAEKLFLPFEQEVREGAHKFGGVGLGLAIARAIVVMHGGNVHAESKGHGSGATFIVSLPLV